MKTELTNEEKKELRDKIAAGAETGAQKAAAAARIATGWRKWALILLAVLLAGVALFLNTGCEQMQRLTPAQVQQAGRLTHGAYHAVTGKPCILVLPVDEVDK